MKKTKLFYPYINYSNEKKRNLPTLNKTGIGVYVIYEDKKIVYVEPTIIIEIILQFIITYIIYNNKTGYIYYGIMMSILLYLTNLWRRVPRLGKITDSNITIFSLLLTSIISYVKCNNNDNNKLNINFNIFNNNYLKNIIFGIISIFFGLCASNDININLLTKIKNEF